jgi:hypothetical protein
MKVRILLILAATMVVAGLVPGAGHAAGTGTKFDDAGDTIDPIVSQNEATKTRQNIPSADIADWSADFNSSTKVITFSLTVNGVIPKAGTSGVQVNAPPGFVGVSYRLFFTSTATTGAQTKLQYTGWSCGSYDTGDTSAGAKTHQDETNYAQCTLAQAGPYQSPNWKLFLGYSVRQNVTAQGIVQEGDVEWGTFDNEEQGLSFNSMKAHDPCTTGASPYVIGGGTRGIGGTCPWGAQVTTVSTSPRKDKLVVTMPYSPTRTLIDDGDDNAVHNDEARHYDLVVPGGTVNGIIPTAWVDQVVGLPEPICVPTDPVCGGDWDPTDCIDAEAGDVDTACANTEVGKGVAGTVAYAGRPTECTVGGERAGDLGCIQEIGGFVYLVDWASSFQTTGTAQQKDSSYDMGVFSWPLPGYVASAQCPYHYGFRQPDGVQVNADNDRNTGYSGVTLTYGVRVAKEEQYNTTNGRKPGYTNVIALGPTAALIPNGGITATNPLKHTVSAANPNMQPNGCTYTPLPAAKFVDANGINGITS